MTELRAEWTRLGVGFAGEPAASVIDLEELVLRSADESPRDPRLFWGAASWLARYGDLVDGRRLSWKLGRAKGRPELAALIVASRCHGLRGLLTRCARLPRPRPLFDIVASTPFLENRVRAGALPQFRDWGLLLDEVCLCPDAIRPLSWILRHNRNLLLRAVIGADLKAELLAALLNSSEPQTASELCRRQGRQYASVHAALHGLSVPGLVHASRDGNRVLYRVPSEVLEWLELFPGARSPGKVPSRSSSERLTTEPGGTLVDAVRGMGRLFREANVSHEDAQAALERTRRKVHGPRRQMPPRPRRRRAAAA